MNRPSVPPLRVKSQELSLWQSVVAAHAIRLTKESEGLEGTLNLTHVQEHPMVSGTSFLAAICEKNNSIESHLFIEEPNDTSSDDEIIAYFSSLFFQLARNQTNEDAPEKAMKLCNELRKEKGDIFRKFSNDDTCGWAYCLAEYINYGIKNHHTIKYNDWTKEGKGDLNFGVIDYKLPNDAKVAIIGDWGTGMEDAKHLLEVILKNHQPDAIIHLGDIYYAGTPDECNDNFANVFDTFYKNNPRYTRIPIFTIPGNHDYYCYGYAYYDMVANLNTSLKVINAKQEASYFCLRTEDNRWQFLGMDTGYNDNNPANAFNPTGDGPDLHTNEPAWHKHKLDHFDGGTILLSHHQLFSGNAKINGSDGTFGSFPYLNKNLGNYI